MKIDTARRINVNTAAPDKIGATKTSEDSDESESSGTYSGSSVGGLGGSVMEVLITPGTINDTLVLYRAC